MIKTNCYFELQDIKDLEEIRDIRNQKKFTRPEGPIPRLWKLLLFQNKKILKKKIFYPKKMTPYFLKPQNSFEVDNYDDLNLAKILFRND